jgi:hypothetical protein
MVWNNIKDKFFLIITAILIIVICLQRCGGGKVTPSVHDTTVTTKTVYKEVVKEIPKYIIKWTTKTEHIHDTTLKIDTAYVLGDYFSTYYYKDSLKSDTLKLYIYDSVSQNKIKNRSLKYTLTYPTVTINKNIVVDKNEFYIGLGLIGSKTGIGFFGPELLLRTKKKAIYGVGVGINGSFEPQLSLRTYWKIGKK